MAIQRATEATPREAEAMPSEPRPRLFTVDEYYKMAEVGILRPDERVQLIEGKIIEMPPSGSEHADLVDSIAERFGDRLRPRARIRVQNQLELAELAHPEPDVALIRRPVPGQRSYRRTHPGLSDLLLIVEVSDSTLRFDLGEKALMYARHGVTDLWVVDVSGDRVVVHREPTADGYASVRSFRRGEIISPLAFPDVTFTADEILDGSEA
jgi:Uma2 family endonuclease